MNKKVYKTLEFDKIINILTELAGSSQGKKYCENLTPITDIEKIKERQQETSDAVSRLFRFGNISFSGITDVSVFRQRLDIGGSLNPSELLAIAGILSVAGTAVRYEDQAKGSRGYNGDTDDKKSGDSLTNYFDSLSPVTDLKVRIQSTIISADEIADDATPLLRSIRREMNGFNEKIRSEMNRLLTGKVKDFLQDSIVTERDGRYCIPVKSEYKSQVAGIVHDQSASGQTLFIEPLSAVKLNNELKELEIKERKEIERFLSEISSEAAEHITEIDTDYKMLSELDFIFAKGNLAINMNAVAPILNADGRINLKKARHPLLDQEKVVPIDINLGIDFNQLIITGPNTGGKTVTLKTVGLLTLMAQAGLHIPAGDRSEMAVFHNIYADIGDEQSIEQSLSTFSGHMTNIVKILHSVEQSGNQSLVMFDELCAGTDPVEGAALATSILNELHREGIRTLATTHYSELKVYALSTDGVENASCEFSIETLSPTYRLLIGIPGKSNAFSISKKLGLSDTIIGDAKERIAQEDQSFEDMISDLEEKRLAMERAEDKIRRDNESVESLRAEIMKEKKSLEMQKANLLAEAHQDAARILKEAKDEADQTIKTFRKMKTDSPDMQKMEQMRTGIGKKLSDAQSKTAVVTKLVPSPNGTVKAKNIKVGDKVRVLSMNVTGTVHTLPDKRGELQVTMGIMTTKVKLTDIEMVPETSTADAFRKKKRDVGSAEKSASPSTASFGKASSISPEIKLLGMTVDEAVSKLDKYIDDAYMSHLKEVRIVHGKGTGALRTAVQHYLDGNAYVKTHHPAAFGEGDAGVTIAEFY